MKIPWLKLDTGILKDEKIEIIRSYPEGDSLFTIWIGLLCLAMRSCVPGYLYVADGIPYAPDDLVKLFGVEKKTLEMAIGLFKKYGMIDILEGDLIEITNFREHQAIDKIEYQREQTRMRVARYREKQKRVTGNSVTCNGDVTQQSKSKKENKIKKKEYAPTVSMLPNTYTDLCKRFGKGVIDEYIEKISDWQLSNGKRKKDMAATIKNWMRRDKGVGSISELEIKVPAVCSDCGKSVSVEIKHGADYCYSCKAKIGGGDEKENGKSNIH